MKRLKIPARKIAVLSLVLLIGCSRSKTVKPPFVQRSAVFKAASGPDTATSLVENNYSMDSEGHAEHYRGKMMLQQVAIEIRYEFVGTTFCPVSEEGDAWDNSDVYVLVIQREKEVSETIPFVYRGGAQVVVDKPDLRIVLEQGVTGSTAQ